MRKQSDSNPPELNRHNRLINSSIRSAKYKRPNALKHGVYATPALIQVQNGKPVVVGPAKYAEAKPIFPVLKWKG